MAAMLGIKKKRPVLSKLHYCDYESNFHERRPFFEKFGFCLLDYEAV
jgi:hypothetical protein